MRTRKPTRASKKKRKAEDFATYEVGFIRTATRTTSEDGVVWVSPSRPLPLIVATKNVLQKYLIHVSVLLSPYHIRNEAFYSGKGGWRKRR